MIGAEETTGITGLAIHNPIVHDYSMDITQLIWEAPSVG